MTNKLIICCLAIAGIASAAPLRIGSKAFTESVVLAEILVQLARRSGATVEHRAELGGTQVLWKALQRGDIDAYVEYSGTLTEELLPAVSKRDRRAVRRALREVGIGMSDSLGFQNTYAIGMKRELAERLGVKKLSDLARHPELRWGLSHEFLDRAEGWKRLQATYALPHGEVRGLHHDIAYKAMGDGQIDLTDLYSTDAEIAYYDLAVLADDRHVFPEYEAMVLYRLDLKWRAPALLEVFDRVEGSLDETAMIALNERAKIKKESEASVAALFLKTRFPGAAPARAPESRAARWWRYTKEHLFLVGIALFLSVVVALPLGIVAARRRRLGAVLLGIAGVLQTIPSLALLVFMIPILGIGAAPAIVALALYGLLPILRNTYVGLTDIPRSLIESADALGLSSFAKLGRIELPLASRAILAGIKTSAVIAVGTATLGALIGAGGYGEPILVGIRRDDLSTILEGAIPAALLAIVVQLAFSLAERRLVPKGLRL